MIIMEAIMKEKISWKNAIIIFIATNLATAFIVAALCVFTPFSIFKDRNAVTDGQYEFIRQFSKMNYVKDEVNKYYVDKGTISQDKMVDGAIKGMVSSIGDPYTAYLDKGEYDALKQQTRGYYDGLGMYLANKDGKIMVASCIEDSPALKAGIKTGDIISKINGSAVSYGNINSAIANMKGKEGEKVTLTIEREGEPAKDYSIKKAKIVIKSVKYDILPNSIGYIRITLFDENTAGLFDNALNVLLNKGIKGLVIDLRDNPGGLVTAVTKVADRLIGEGTIVYTIDQNEKKEVYKSDAKKLDLPLALIVNGGSASASEILSGAVRDTNSGVIVGTKTFGKGLVQSIIDLKDQTALKVTIARYYTPSGECIQGKGITPAVVIDMPEEQRRKFVNNTLSYSEDSQLKKAQEVLNTKIK